MTSFAHDERALADLVRLAEFLAKDDSAAGEATVELITGAVEVLAAHPLIGRRVEGELRELVISRGRTGYLALYEYHAALDHVVVLAIRHQREVGFDD